MNVELLVIGFVVGVAVGIPVLVLIGAIRAMR